MKGRQGAWAFVAGLVFALGLGLSGMTRPSKVTGFLDVTGSWDASLALVMGAALAISAPAFAWAQRRGRPILDERFHLPKRRAVDPSLVAGAAIFGIGWGASGYCPGPAIVAAGSGSGRAILFTVAMCAGMVLFEVAGRARLRRSGPIAAE